jgi:hypothetical protein
MAKSEKDPASEGSTGSDRDLSQHSWVSRVKPEPGAPPVRVRRLAGIVGDSDRPGFRRLYFSPEFTFYAEFRADDVVYVETIPEDRPPFVGTEATRVAIRRDAQIDFVRSRTSQPVDDFDLDIRVGRAARARPRVAVEAETWEAECPGPSFFAPCDTDFTCVCGDTVQITICRGATCIDVCDTRFRTCDTCRTDCDQATCATCGTCDTACNQATCATCNQATCATCNTCQTQCNQATCHTCATACNQATCHTCETQCGGTCNPHVFTCGPNPQCV